MKKQNLINTPLLGVLCSVMALAVTPVAQAALLSYTGTVQIDTTTTAGEIDLNDVFDFSFTYDDAITDIDGGFGEFPNAVTAFSFARVSGTGTWDPAGGTFSLPQDLITAEDNPNELVISTSVNTPLGAAPNPFFQLLFDGGFAINDTGIGQTIDQQIGGPLPGDINVFTSARVNIGSFDTGDASGSITAFSATVVPVPAAVWLFGSGLLGLIGFARASLNNA